MEEDFLRLAQMGQGCWIVSVRIWDGGGDRSGWSEPATFGMGQLSPGDWNAEWITPVATPDLARRSVVDENGETPAAFEPFRIDPVGRYLGIDIRKAF